MINTLQMFETQGGKNKERLKFLDFFCTEIERSKILEIAS